MTYILSDLGADLPDLVLKNSDWGPIAQVLSESGLLDQKRSESIKYNLTTEITAHEAELIAGHLLMHLEVTKLPDDVNRRAFRNVAEFAQQCSGFEVC